MTTLTIILITWFIAGLVTFVIIQNNIKDDIRVRDLWQIGLVIVLGYLSLILTLLILLIKNVTLPKFKLPKGDKVIWKYPKKN